MTAKKKSCLHVRLAVEDAARSLRLKEEIIGRVEEMARILARAQGKAPVLPVVAFARREERATAGDGKDMATAQFTYDDGSVGCYDEEKAVCCDGPCPC